MQARTLHVMGTGGVRFDLDVPEGGHARERFIERVASGDLVALDDDGYPIDRIALLAELDPDNAAADLVAPAEGDALRAMNVKDLRALAGERGVDLGDATKKADIIDVLRAAEDADDDD